MTSAYALFVIRVTAVQMWTVLRRRALFQGEAFGVDGGFHDSGLGEEVNEVGGKGARVRVA